MNSTNLLEKRLQALSNVQMLRFQHPPPLEAPTTALTITLARAAGTPGTSVAREVAARLGWDVYDHELLELMARDMGRRVALLEQVDERQQGWMRAAIDAWAQVPSVGESWYTRQLVETVVQLGAKGRCVIVGRGAAHILPRETTLRVRLIGRREDRIAFLALRLGLDTEEATRRLEETDRERQEFVRYHFHQDATDATLYDLVLNASRWSVADCADTIVNALKRLELRKEAAHTA